MIETHVVNAYLPGPARQAAFFFWLTFVNGLVAPSFLFAAGFSALLEGNRRWDEWLRFGPAFWRRMRRVGFIALVAYYTHLQGFRLSRYLEARDPRIWADTLQVDILQCIVVSLIVLQALVLLLRRRPRVAAAAAILALGIVLATPWVWAQNFLGRLPLGLALFLNPHGISFFPLFPWMAFALAGAVAAHLFIDSVESGRDAGFMRAAAFGGAVLVAAGLLLRAFPLSLPGRQQFFTTSPLYVCIRLGFVLVVMAGLWLAERYGRRSPEAIRVAGQESLLVYGVHLWLIFGVLREKHVGPILGLEAPYWECFLIAGSVIVLMLALARFWHALKRRHPVWTRRGLLAVVLGMIVVFVLR